jgi:prophage antirepressor-like protein
MQGLIKVFEGTELTVRRTDAGRWGLTAEEFGRALGAAHPREYTNKLIARNRDEIEPFISEVKLTSEAGSRCATFILDQGVLILAMLASTDRAKAFRRFVAELLLELQAGEKQVLPSQVVHGLLSKIKRLEDQLAAQRPQIEDPRAIAARVLIENVDRYGPTLQRLIVDASLGDRKEPLPVWTAAQIAGELAHEGYKTSAIALGKLAKKLGIQCSKDERENAYGFWSVTSVTTQIKVVSQFQYTQAGRNALKSALQAQAA